MRTILASIFRGNAPRSADRADQVEPKRDYHVEGYITFVLKNWNDIVDPKEFGRAILKADEAFPWSDPVTIRAVDGRVFCVFKHSIHHLFDAKPIRTFDCKYKREKQWQFRIWPIQQEMRRAQLLGYENYLAKLAQEVATTSPFCVKEVRSEIRITADKSFAVT